MSKAIPFHPDTDVDDPLKHVHKLSKGATAGISVAVVVVVIGIVLIALYFTLWKTPNNGPSKFGSIEIRDKATNVAKSVYNPGDTLALLYVPAAQYGFGGHVQWSVSVNGNITNIPSASATNSATWTIPLSVFSTQVFIKVADKNIPADWIASPFFTVQPQLKIISGPGTSAGEGIQASNPVTTVVNLDTTVQTLSAIKDWTITFSLTTDPTKVAFTGTILSAAATNLTLTRGATPITQQQVSLTWSAITTGTYYYQLKTKVLVNSGYPSELAIVSAFPVTISNSTPPPPSGKYTIGTVNMVNNATGAANGTFAPGTAVTLNFTITAGTFDGQKVQWGYSLDQGNTQQLIGYGTTQNFTGFSIPTGFVSPTFQIYIIPSDGITYYSTNCIINPITLWDSPNPGDTIQMYPDAGGYHNVIATNVTVTGINAQTQCTWRVGIQNANQENIFAASTTIGSQTATLVNLQWYFNPQNQFNIAQGASVPQPTHLVIELNYKGTVVTTVAGGASLTLTCIVFTPVMGPFSYTTIHGGGGFADGAYCVSIDSDRRLVFDTNGPAVQFFFTSPQPYGQGLQYVYLIQWGAPDNYGLTFPPSPGYDQPPAADAPVGYCYMSTNPTQMVPQPYDNTTNTQWTLQTGSSACQCLDLYGSDWNNNPIASNILSAWPGCQYVVVNPDRGDEWTFQWNVGPLMPSLINYGSVPAPCPGF